MKKHLILSMLLLGFAGMLEAENVQRTLPDVVEGVRDEVISVCSGREMGTRDGSGGTGHAGIWH